MRLVRPVLAALAAIVLLAFTAPPAAAKLVIEIDKSAQRMTVSLDGEKIHTWPVSTGVRAYDTPGGEYTPFRMEKDHFSREWDDAPMPHSIFFTKKGHAIHGTTHLRSIGQPASHGCVRLEPENARVLFGLVKRQGMPNTSVVLLGETPAVTAPAVARRAPDNGERSNAGRARDREPRQYEPRYAEPRQYEPRYVEPGQGYARRQYRQGYWAQRADGSVVYIDREREYRPPPRFFFGGPRWD